jgi:hypothetical protein
MLLVRPALAKRENGCDFQCDEAVSLRPTAVRIPSIECGFHGRVDLHALDAFAGKNVGKENLCGGEKAISRGCRV